MRDEAGGGGGGGGRGSVSGRNSTGKGPEVAKCSELCCNTVATGHSIYGYLNELKLKNQFLITVTFQVPSSGYLIGQYRL